jgi:putative tryptophan/tyrosine transport system substrate-binding protein
LAGELTAKRLELLRELVPGAARIALLVEPNNARVTETIVRDAEAAARSMGLQIRVLDANTNGEIDAAFTTFAREHLDALFVGSSPLFNTRRIQLVHLASYHRVPATYSGRLYAEAGGFMSYGASVTDALRQVGVYTGRMLSGTKPADLPVMQSTKLELVINHQSARMLGLSVPDKLLVAADEVIE